MHERQWLSDFPPQFARDCLELFWAYDNRTIGLRRYLERRATIGFTAEQFVIYRANYFARTELTIRTVAQTAVRAVEERDWKSLRSLAQNLCEESGEHSDAENHQILLEQSHNLHGKCVFGCEPISIVDACLSPHFLAETRAFREQRLESLSRGTYTSLLGASFAQETTASGMLELFLMGFFTPYQRLHPDASWSAVISYFEAHLDSGVEDEHGAMASECLHRHLLYGGNAEEALLAISDFLSSQAAIWEALHVRLSAAEESGTFVPVGAGDSR